MDNRMVSAVLIGAALVVLALYLMRRRRRTSLWEWLPQPHVDG